MESNRSPWPTQDVVWNPEGSLGRTRLNALKERQPLPWAHEVLPPRCPLHQATRFIPAPNSTHHISGPKSFPQGIQKMCPEALVSRAVTCRRPFWALPCGHMVTYFCKVYKTRVKPPLVKTPASLHWDAASLPLFLMLALEWAGQSWVGKLGRAGQSWVWDIHVFSVFSYFHT